MRNWQRNLASNVHLQLRAILIIVAAYNGGNVEKVGQNFLDREERIHNGYEFLTMGIFGIAEFVSGTEVFISENIFYNTFVLLTIIVVD